MKNAIRKTCTNAPSPLSNNTFELWQKKTIFLCKRGNLETELLLQSYIHSLNSLLTVDNKQETIKNKTQLIDQLLQETEQNLFHWLLNMQNSASTPVNPIPPHFLPLIKEIRDNYLK